MPSPHPRARAALVLMLVTLAGTAHAEPADDARRHFKAGLDAAAAHSYQAAVDEFLAAWDAMPHPATAFNIARSYEDMNDNQAAVLWYERFKALSPDSTDADDPLHRARLALAASVASVAPPVAAPTPDSVERLTALDAERAALVQRLAQQGLITIAPTAPEAAPPPAEPTPSPAAAPAPAPAPPTVVAEDTGNNRESLQTGAYDSMIVTASRYAQDPLDSPASITVLTAEDLHRSGAVNVMDALRRVVGVDVMSMSAGVPYVGIRGFNSEMTNKVLWLIDGRPSALEFLATPFPVSLPIGMDEIDRIEITRGPGSALYGANAVTGVVNIITRRPGEGPAFQASTEGGLNSYLAASLAASGKKGRFSYRAGAGYHQEGRFEKELADIPADGPIVPFRTNQDLGDQRFRADLRLDATFGKKGWASLSGQYGKGFTEFYSKAALGNAGLEGEVGNVRTDLSYGPLHVRAYWQREAGVTTPWLSSVGSGRSTQANVRDDIAELEVEGAFKVITGAVTHHMQVGGDYRFKQYRAGVIGEGFEIPRLEHHASLFGQYQASFKWLQAIASLRWDRHPLIKSANTLAPRGALVFHVTKTTAIRASVGSAYRAMNGLESYVNLDLNTTADGYFVAFQGAATSDDPGKLGPERITTAELGVRDESSSWHKLDAAVYWNRLTDLIDIGPVQQKLGAYDADAGGYPFGVSTWTNTPAVYDAVGGEVDLSVFPVDGLDVFANVSLERIFTTDGDKHYIDGSTALAHINAGVEYRAPFRMDFTVTGHYVSGQVWRTPSFDSRGAIAVEERPLPGRVLMVARVAGHPMRDPDLELALTLWNPLGFSDKLAFREHPDGQIVGPRLYGSVSVAF